MIVWLGLLAGCAHRAEVESKIAGSVPANTASIFPPPGGPGITGVIETRFPNAIRQGISLITNSRTIGENKVSILLYTDEGGDGSDARLADMQVDQTAMLLEARGAFPRVAMVRSPYYVRIRGRPRSHRGHMPLCMAAHRGAVETFRRGGSRTRRQRLGLALTAPYRRGLTDIDRLVSQ